MSGLLRQPVVRTGASRPVVTDAQESFAGGVNSNGAFAPVGETQFAGVTNMRVMPNGAISKRPGLLLLSPTADHLHPWRRSTTGVYLTSTAAGTITHYSLDPLTHVLTTTAVAAGSALHYGSAHFRDNTAECLYLAAGGAAKLSKWTGAVFSDRSIGLSTGLKRLWVYNQRLFGITTADQTLYWSALNNGDTIGDTSTSGGFATIRTFGGQDLLGGFALGSTNFLLHRSAISIFRGLTFDDIAITAGVQGFASDVGVVSDRGYCVADGVGYVVSTRGLAVVTEGGVQLVDSPDAPDPVAFHLRAYPEQASTALVAFNERAKEVWIYIKSDAPAYRVYIYNTVRAAFTGACDLNDEPSDLAASYTAGGEPQWMALTARGCGGVDLATGNVFRDFTFNFASSVNLRRLYTDAPAAEKSWRRAVVVMGVGGDPFNFPVYGSTTGATLSYRALGGSLITPGVTMLSQETAIVPLSGRSGALDVTIGDSASANSIFGWEVLRVDVQAFNLGLRGT